MSDLFIWRHSEEWQTFFELTDVCGLFVDPERAPGRPVTFVFFDRSGALFHEEHVALTPYTRRTVDLSEFTALAKDEIGTFCVFHSHTPQAIAEFGSFIAERGYVSYRYNNAPMTSYVHGNLDAVARLPSHSLQLLGGGSIRQRQYRLQHALEGPAVYELIVVNPSRRRRSVACCIRPTRAGERPARYQEQIAPFGCHTFRIETTGPEPTRAIIESRLVMARPVIFRLRDSSADVFHG